MLLLWAVAHKAASGKHVTFFRDGRFSIRSLLILATLCSVATVYFYPFFDDTRFTKTLKGFNGKPISELVEHIETSGRKYGTYWDGNHRLVALIVGALDGRDIYIAVDRSLAPFSKECDLATTNMGDCRVVESNDLVNSQF